MPKTFSQLVADGVAHPAPESLVGPLAEAIQESVWDPTAALLRSMEVH